MFKIIEAICEPVRFLSKNDENIFPGAIVEFEEIEGLPRLKISNGSRPFGIVGEFTKNNYGLVPVWFDSMLFETDIYDKEVIFKKDDRLYVSNNGLLTSNKPNKNAISVGYVQTPPVSNYPLLEVSWI